MDYGLLPAMLLLGLVSSVHCAGMCGGIVGAFSMTQALLPKGVLLKRQLVFNAGRISSYAAGGAAAAALGSLGAYVTGALSVQIVLYGLANGVLILAGLQLAGIAAPMASVEALGAPLWRRVRPFAARAISSRTLPHAYAAGLAWGWLPCGFVYSALAVAAFSSVSGGPAGGALAMLAFGLGTLPALLAAGVAASSLRRALGRRAVRIAAGGAMVAFGAYGLAHAGGLAESIRNGLLCF